MLRSAFSESPRRLSRNKKCWLLFAELISLMVYLYSDPTTLYEVNAQYLKYFKLPITLLKDNDKDFGQALLWSLLRAFGSHRSPCTDRPLQQMKIQQRIQPFDGAVQRFTITLIIQSRTASSVQRLMGSLSREAAKLAVQCDTAIYLAVRSR